MNQLSRMNKILSEVLRACEQAFPKESIELNRLV
jgi:hypothetical protein